MDKDGLIGLRAEIGRVVAEAVDQAVGQALDSKPQHRAGWDVPRWCAAVGVGRSSFYALPEGLRPLSVKIGRRRLILEAPDQFLRRVASGKA